MGLLFNSESPIVVVLSESMEPAFERGDLLLLSLTSSRISHGDITVYKIKGRDIPIVHRVINVHDDAKTGKQLILTKGDNNEVDDRGLYNVNQMWIAREDLMGRVVGHLPKVGMLTIIMNDYPAFKYVLIGMLGIFVLLNRDNQK